MTSTAPQTPVPAAVCPSCQGQLPKTPKRKTKCPLCGEAIYVRQGRLFSLRGTLEYDETCAAGLAPNPASELLDAMPSVTHAQFLRLSPEERGRCFWVPGLDDETWIARAKQRVKWCAMGGSATDPLFRLLLCTGQYTESAAARLSYDLLFYAFLAMSCLDRQRMLTVVDYFPYWQYRTMGDEAVRENHAALHGLTLRYDDPFWNDHFPPWEWGCRCSVVSVDEDEFEEIRRNRTSGHFEPVFEEKTKGWTLSPQALEELHRGVLDDGSGRKFDLAPADVDLDGILGPRA